MQELIAPHDIIFFGRKWDQLGRKMDLIDSISSITGIAVEPLLSIRSVFRESIACRMSWAARRRTTRIEDVAYSLLGIFGVHMPLLYGEGNHAFIRLQEEIMKVSDDQTVLAWGFERLEAEDYQDDSEIDREEDQVEDKDDDEDEDFADVGVFANSPRSFRNSASLVPISHDKVSPFSMTNTGLQITLPITEYMVATVGILSAECNLESHRNCYLGMLLSDVGDKKDSLFNNRFKRKGTR